MRRNLRMRINRLTRLWMMRYMVRNRLVLRKLPASERFMIGYGTGQRNMGLLVAALGAGVSPTTFLFFALAQFPIYLLPWLLGGIAGRIRRREAADGR